jgi:hypothetical protein
MSKIKAALITLMLGSSTAAMASPSLSFSANAQVSFGASSGPVIRDHRTIPAPAPIPAARPMPSTTWISVGSQLHLANGRDIVKPQLGTYSQVRLQASSGMSFIQTVTVKFTDGATQKVTFNQWLMNRNAMLNLDLQANHRAIESITVKGSAAGRNASYDVFVQGSRVVQLPYPVYQPDLGAYHPSSIYQPINVTGTYSSNYGVVTLNQQGNHITGVCNQGTIDGTIEGNVIKYRWAQPGGSGGLGTWTVDRSLGMDGTFGGGLSFTDGGSWDLTFVR